MSWTTRENPILEQKKSGFSPAVTLLIFFQFYLERITSSLDGRADLDSRLSFPRAPHNRLESFQSTCLFLLGKDFLAS